MKKVVTGLAIVFIIFSLSAAVAAATATPGSEGDPVVTKSYVDTQIAQLKSSGGTASSVYQPVQLTAGQKMIGNEGTEIIVRSGETTAIDNGANGVSDVTGAMDLMTGQGVPLNHLLLIPRSDGRGIQANTEVWVMVRGSYTLK
jgi:hypothetical protein